MVSYQTAYKLEFKGDDGRSRTLSQDGDYLGMRVQFSIDKTLRKGLNRGSVTITNPSDATLSVLQSPGLITLSAGYAGDTATILVAESESVSIQDDGATRNAVITVLEGNADKALLNYKKSFGKNTTTTTVVQDIANFLVKNVKSVQGFNAFSIQTPKTYKQKQAYSNDVFEVLEALLKPTNSDYWISNGYFSVVAQNQFSRDTEVSISSVSGLIGSPKKISEKDKDGKVRNGVEIRSILNYNFDVGRRIKLKSRSFDNEIFKIDSVSHTGDSFGGNWTSTIRAFDLAD